MEGDLERRLGWDGMVNGRELGGLTTVEGAIRTGALIRSASPHTLSDAGWRQLTDHGITTVLDLRGPDEVDRYGVPPERRPSGVRFLNRPLEPPGYADRWRSREDRWKLHSPHFFAEFLAEHRDRVADAITTIAQAPPGGVVVHCHGGQDRSGLVVASLLDLLGVDRWAIAADYWLSFEPRPQAVGDGPPPDRERYRALVVEALEAHPAVACFADEPTAERVRQALVDRLVVDLDRAG